MKIEEFRRNEANMNAREQRLARKDVDDAVSAGAQASLNLMQQQYGLKHAEGLALVSNSYALDRFNVEQKTAYAQMANQRAIQGDQTRMQLGIHALEAKYRAANPTAGSLGFFKALAPDGNPVKGMEIYSKSMGVEAKGDEALVASYIKNPTALLALEATDPELARYIKQKIKMQLVRPTAASDADRP